tara:strand:- start:746 stop:1915 length:1170 start_codon:yes stop_codon:yes gene_type:complete
MLGGPGWLDVPKSKPKDEKIGNTTDTDGAKTDNTNQTDNAPAGPRDPNKSGHKKVMVYPTSRGQTGVTGDSLLIKCLKYQPPKTTYSAEYNLFTAKNNKKINGNKHGKGNIVTNKDGSYTSKIDPKSFQMVNQGASERSMNQKHLYYVELPIPQDVNDSNTITWGDDTMNILQLAGLAAANQMASQPGRTFQQLKNDIATGILGNVSSLDQGTRTAVTAAITGKAIDVLGGQIKINSAIGRAAGKVLNSNLELLFDSVNLRSFPFSINFSPRNPKEGQEVKQIIRAFKSSMAAKKNDKNSQGGQGGAFLSAPDVFQLRYLHNGSDHPFLNSFKMCALTAMQVNYTNAGTYATYSDGTPVSLKMNLTFKELNPIYFEDYSTDNKVAGVGF